MASLRTEAQVRIFAETFRNAAPIGCRGPRRAWERMSSVCLPTRLVGSYSGAPSSTSAGFQVAASPERNGVDGLETVYTTPRENIRGMLRRKVLDGPALQGVDCFRDPLR